ncbi:MAG: glycoside hydrolase family 28 protein [Flavobacteriales bacterium]|nr:glycoside hydrolase family 28 protein [Flavobacteriales bacterium]
MLPSAAEYDIRDYGAIGDAKQLNTAFIQDAIDNAHEAGGGTVIIPKGKFVSGGIVLKSGVELHLQKGACLLGSTNISDYRSISRNKWSALIMADAAQDIAITGKGVIDGRGRSLAMHVDSLFYAGQLDSSLYQMTERRPVAHARPQIIQFVNCSGIRVTGVSILNSSSWVQSYDMCRNIEIDRIRVYSLAYWNNDGIDIIDSRNVRITNSYFNSTDDGICLKSYQRAGGLQVWCDSIYIGNCTVRSSASAVKLGTSSFGGFRNVVIEKIKVFDTFRSAIALECWETGILENILVQDIKATNTGNALFIRLSKREKFNHLPMGKLRNVVVRNMKVQIPFDQPDYEYDFRGPALPFFHNTMPASITGIPGHPVENIVLENIRISYPGRGNPAYANLPTSRIGDVPEKISEYPEFSMFGELPAWGLYVRHADGLTLQKIRFKLRKPDYRPAVAMDDAINVDLKDVKFPGDSKPEPIFLNNSSVKE